MADVQKPLPCAHLGGNHHQTGIIPRKKMWHTSEQGMDRISQNRNHLSNDNQINEVRYTLLWRREAGIFTKRCRSPLSLVRFYMELFLPKVCPKTIMIMGRWARNVVLRYIGIHVRYLRKGISIIMTHKQELYTILEAHIVYPTAIDVFLCTNKGM